jgi:hypothetical protein
MSHRLMLVGERGVFFIAMKKPRARTYVEVLSGSGRHGPLERAKAGVQV